MELSQHVLVRLCAQQTLDANRVFARELARSFSARMGKELWLVFPDDAEVKQPPATALREASLIELRVDVEPCSFDPI